MIFQTFHVSPSRLPRQDWAQGGRKTQKTRRAKQLTSKSRDPAKLTDVMFKSAERVVIFPPNDPSPSPRIRLTYHPDPQLLINIAIDKYLTNLSINIRSQSFPNEHDRPKKLKKTLSRYHSTPPFPISSTKPHQPTVQPCKKERNPFTSTMHRLEVTFFNFPAPPLSVVTVQTHQSDESAVPAILSSFSSSSFVENLTATIRSIV